MKTNIRVQGIKLTDEEKNYIDEKIFSLISNYFDDDSTACDINLKDINGPRGGIDKEISVVITLAYEKNPIKVTQKGVFIKEVIDVVSEKLNNILRKIKNIKNDRKNNK